MFVRNLLQDDALLFDNNVKQRVHDFVEAAITQVIGVAFDSNAIDARMIMPRPIL